MLLKRSPLYKHYEPILSNLTGYHYHENDQGYVRINVDSVSTFSGNYGIEFYNKNTNTFLHVWRTMIPDKGIAFRDVYIFRSSLMVYNSDPQAECCMTQICHPNFKDLYQLMIMLKLLIQKGKLCS